MRGATAEWRDLDTVATISIHAPLAGCDRAGAPPGSNRTDFNPRTPCGVRRAPHIVSVLKRFAISIHAPLAGCDRLPCPLCPAGPYFNPRTPCGVRPPPGSVARLGSAFQSTRPLRGATCSSPRSALRPVFQSTRPLRGATAVGLELVADGAISIHAPLAGRDMGACPRSPRCAYFNPRAPCGARQGRPKVSLPDRQFQSTRPLRGATCNAGVLLLQGGISIHALLAGRDVVLGSFTVDFM